MPTCFKAYDIRGKVGVDLDAAMAARIGRAFVEVLGARSVVTGRDGRASSPELQAALIAGLRAAGAEVFDIGLAGTEEVYFATDHLRADGGIEVTASHNPIDYNGMKLVGPGSRPLSAAEFAQIAARAGALGTENLPPRAPLRQVDTRPAYAERVAGFVDARRIGPIHLVANAGNGVAGPAFDAVLQVLTRRGARITVDRLHHDPDPSFPNGIPNPLLPENRPVTADRLRAVRADLAVAWDGDFDRCFLFDGNGDFVDGEYVVALLAASVLSRHPGEKIVHDPRVLWNTQETVARAGGRSVLARTGHAFVKAAMRESGAIYGGEMSAHHYFRDFMCCDSGMIPLLLVLEHMGRTGQSLADLVAGMRAAYPSSGEINFRVPDPAAVIAHVEQRFGPEAETIDHLDGLSMSFGTWRMNLRASSTEPLLRLNLETRGDAALLARRTEEIAGICRAFAATDTGA